MERVHLVALMAAVLKAGDHVAGHVYLGAPTNAHGDAYPFMDPEDAIEAAVALLGAVGDFARTIDALGADAASLTNTIDSLRLENQELRQQLHAERA
jgi:hypothetical protein